MLTQLYYTSLTGVVTLLKIATVVYVTSSKFSKKNTIQVPRLPTTKKCDLLTRGYTSQSVFKNTDTLGTM